ncbi:hypothetical protein B0H11DRAFT_2248367 [Mycena galericulata]|nr:hypothetical protein B0H11DRAFT_2248367 [Mycena galericulata]
MPFPKMFDTYVPSSMPEFFALVKLNPEYVPLQTLRAKITPPAGFMHTQRCYYIARALLHNGFPWQTPGVPQITREELSRRLYHACLLHHLGWGTNADLGAHPAHAM